MILRSGSRSVSVVGEVGESFKVTSVLVFNVWRLSRVGCHGVGSRPDVVYIAA